MLKKSILAICIAIILIVVILIINNKNNTDAISIGALYPMTGGLSVYGELSQRSAQIAVDEINKNGGVNGKKLVLKVQDHKCDTKTALSAFKQLHDIEDVRIFVSAACSGTVIGLGPEIKDSTLLVSTITSPKVSGLSKNIFRNYVSDEKESQLFADFIEKKKFKTIGMFFEETDYAKGIALNTEKYLDPQTKVMKESFSTNTTDIRTQITKLKAENPDVLVLSVQSVNTGELVLSEIEKQQYRPKTLIVNENILKSAELIKKHSQLLENAISADYMVEDSNKIKEFTQKYKDTYGADCTQINICTTAYDNIYLIADALKANPKPNKISNELQKIHRDGVSGVISFDSLNDRENTTYSLFKIVNGTAIKI